MARLPRSIERIVLLVPALIGLAALAPAPVQAQVFGVRGNNQPYLPSEDQRSGLLTRQAAIMPTLPPDPDRDSFYGTRWGDHHGPTHPNSPFTGGLYGLKYKNQCVASYNPYFRGTCGGSTAGPCCEPVEHRAVGNIVHPWRPVGGYYAGGSAVPIYDLDPLVPGPGVWPFPRLFFHQRQGG